MRRKKKKFGWYFIIQKITHVKDEISYLMAEDEIIREYSI